MEKPQHQTPLGRAGEEVPLEHLLLLPKRQPPVVPQDQPEPIPQDSTVQAGSSPQEDVLSTTLPTGPQQIEALLAPYVKELTTLGPEYQQEMNFLAPYLSGAHQENFQQILAGSQADESPTGSKAVSAADAAAGQAIENAQAPGFGQEAAAGKAAQQAAPYEGQLNTALAYQKYLATYGGQAVNTSQWPSGPAAAYQAVMGSSGGSGLPSITNAAAAGQANANLTATQGQTGSPATGY